jgi:hypothetical protein
MDLKDKGKTLKDGQKTKKQHLFVLEKSNLIDKNCSY